MPGPSPGSAVQIHSYKHNGLLHRLWQTTIVLKRTENEVIGANNNTKVTESDGETWITRDPAICYFHAAYWFNIIGMLRHDGVHYYCNICSPFIFDEGALKYIDYDLDIKVYPDMSFDVLDEDEYEAHKSQMNYPESLDDILDQHMAYLTDWIRQRKGPFSDGFIDQWYDKYLTYL